MVILSIDLYLPACCTWNEEEGRGAGQPGPETGRGGLTTGHTRTWRSTGTHPARRLLLTLHVGLGLLLLLKIRIVCWYRFYTLVVSLSFFSSFSISLLPVAGRPYIHTYRKRPLYSQDAIL